MRINKIAILGATGLLGQALCREAKCREIDVVRVARKDADVNLDICNNVVLRQFLDDGKFDVVINCCAIVNHTFCDEHPSEAYSTNARPSATLAQCATEFGFKYVYISTDGYFIGGGRTKNTESAQVSFLNEYARTKFVGEAFTLTNPKALVIRTNIVGFRGKVDQPTFVEWALETLKFQKPMSLFTDYYTSSISVTQLSKAIFDMLPKDPCGIFNVASREVSSKAEFISELAKAFGYSLKNATFGSVTSLNSKRADSLGLDVTKAETMLGYKLPNLSEVIAQLKSEFVGE